MQLTKRSQLYWFFLALCVLVVLISISAYYSSFKNKVPEEEYPITRVFSYSFSIRNPTAVPRKSVEFFVFSPMKQTANQLVNRIDSSYSFSPVNVEYPVQLMKFEFDAFAPFETKVVKIKVEVSFSDESNILAESREHDYLGEDRLIEIHDKAIVEQSKKLARQSKIETLKTIYDFVNSHINYAGFIDDDLGAVYALKNKKGDCTEYASLVAALARGNAIPARVVSGFVYPSSGVLNPSDYHAWTEVFLNGKWQIVDALRRNFMVNQDQYLALRFAVDGSSSSDGSSMRLAYSNNDVIISML